MNPLPFLVTLCFFPVVTCVGQQDRHQAIPHTALVKLDKIVDEYVANDAALGAELLVMQGEQVLIQTSHGMIDRQDERQWENNTLCNIRSMTKPITAAAAQILIDRGKLDLDEPVSQYLKSFDNDKSRTITVRQVLTHRAGLPLTNVMMPYQYKTLAEQVAKIGESGPQFEPGSRFWYSDIGADTAGRLVEKVSGELLHEFVTREIFKPLQMKDTLYGIDPESDVLKTAASDYMKGNNGWIRFWKAGGQPLYPFAWGSQSVYSTTTDYAKFLRMFATGGRVGDQQILSETAVARMLTPVSRTAMMGSDKPAPTGFLDLQSCYGQMMVIYCKVADDESGNHQKSMVAFGHSGSDGTVAVTWPDRKLTVVYFTQSRGGITALQIERAVDRLILRPDQKITTDGVPARFHEYLGQYLKPDGDGEEKASVVYRNGRLILDVPSELPFELFPPNEEGYWKFCLAPDKLKLKFERDESGKVVGINLYRGSKVTRAIKIE